MVNSKSVWPTHKKGCVEYEKFGSVMCNLRTRFVSQTHLRVLFKAESIRRKDQFFTVCPEYQEEKNGGWQISPSDSISIPNPTMCDAVSSNPRARSGNETTVSPLFKTLFTAFRPSTE